LAGSLKVIFIRVFFGTKLVVVFVRISVDKFRSIVNFASCSKTISPILLDFRKDGLHIDLTDGTFTIGVLGHYAPKFFEEYEALGKVKIDVGAITSTLNAFSKIDNTLDIGVKGSKMVIKGKIDKATLEQSKSNTYRFSDFRKVEQKSWGYISPDQKVRRGYEVDFIKFFFVDKKRRKPTFTESLRFEYGEELKAVEETERSVYTRTIKFTKHFGDGNGKIKVDVKMFNKCFPNIGRGWLIFTDEQVILSKVEENKMVTYLIYGYGC